DINNLQDEVKREPAMALDGGVDGLDFYRVINDKWFGYIKQNGLLLLEIGNDQGSDILDILTNFRDVEVKKDLYGNDRMVVARG
ncbi:MAG: protein-(glutamine-N5) methyltransferase, release factor-specific, partial [Eubacterium sp.]